MLFAQQFQVDIAVNSAGAVAVQAAISVSSRPRVPDRTAGRCDIFCDEPVTNGESRKESKREGEEGRDDPVQSRQPLQKQSKHVIKVGIVFELGASGPPADKPLSLVPNRRIEENERVDETRNGEIGEN